MTSRPTRGFTAAVSVFRGTPPGKPLAFYCLRIFSLPSLNKVQFSGRAVTDHVYSRNSRTEVVDCFYLFCPRGVQNPRRRAQRRKDPAAATKRISTQRPQSAQRRRRRNKACSGARGGEDSCCTDFKAVMERRGVSWLRQQFVGDTARPNAARHGRRRGQQCCSR